MNQIIIPMSENILFKAFLFKRTSNISLNDFIQYENEKWSFCFYYHMQSFNIDY